MPAEGWCAWSPGLSPDRAQSLGYRFLNEDMLLERAADKPLFGWGAWGRNLLYDPETGEALTISDGQWIITIGQSGWLGYIATFGLLCLPIFALWWRYRQVRRMPRIPAQAGLLALILGANLVDLLPNATLIPFTWLLAGALLGHAELQANRARAARLKNCARQHAPCTFAGHAHPKPAAHPFRTGSTVMSNEQIPNENDIAIIGMAAHLPGAASVAEFWDNLRAGRSSIRRLSEQELLDAGESAAMLRKPNYVPFAAPLDGFADFDPDLFGFSPKEAAILDPQHRQFLEVAWEAFENAGHPPRGEKGTVGVFSGCGMGSYFYFNLCSNPHLVDDVGMFLLRHTGNDKDFLTTRVSHILDLHGPSVNVQTACSTSLVAVHYAVNALLTGECDMALAGGVTIELPQGRGYLYRENEILSPDGECHAFDHRAQGTVFGSGAGAVVLRRLADAVADGDRIIAVVKGSAINNDGAQKAGYLAPSVEGQAAGDCRGAPDRGCGIRQHQLRRMPRHRHLSGRPDRGGRAGAGLRQRQDRVLPHRVGQDQYRASGHGGGRGQPDQGGASAAAPRIAASLGYEAPNPAIDFDHSPFMVNDSLTPVARRRPLARRCQRAWRGRHQRACGAGRSARARRVGRKRLAVPDIDAFGQIQAALGANADRWPRICARTPTSPWPMWPSP